MNTQAPKKPFRKTLLGNVLIILALCVAFYWIFFGSLSIITRHGKVGVVPKLEGMSVDSAIKVLEKEGFEFVIDSTFDKNNGLNQVLDQQPEAGSKVKGGRIIFLTVNKANPPLVAMPNLLNLSLRSAEAQMRKHGLVFGDTFFVYDIAENTILEQRFNGKIIESGTRIPEGSVIDITVSKGLSDETVNIPDLIGMKYVEALKLLEEKGLRYSQLFTGRISDSATALVYSQYPESRNEYGEPLRVYKGDRIEVRIDQNPTITKRTYLSRPKEDVDSNAVNTPTNQTQSPQTTPNAPPKPRPGSTPVPQDKNPTEPPKTRPQRG